MKLVTRIGAVLITIGLLLVAMGTTAAGVGDDKIVLCHASGQQGTLHFVTLELPPPAVYGPGGHFNEDGTTQAGHEDDYLGACEEETTTTTTQPEDTTTTTTTTTQPEDTTTTTDTVTRTTVPEEPTTTTIPFDVVVTTVVPPTTTTTTTEVPVALPFTGPVGGAGLPMAGAALFLLGSGVLLASRQRQEA